MPENITLRLAEDSQLGRAGQVVTLALTPSDVHVPEEIDTYLAGYQPFGFRADEVSKPILVDTDEDEYRTFSSNNAFRRVNVKSSLQRAVPEVDPESTLAKYKVVDRLVGSFIADRTEANAKKLYRPRQVAAQRCKWALQLDREIDVWSVLTNLATWAPANQVVLAPSAAWNSGSQTSDPIADLKARIVASAQVVTDVWFNQQVAFDFLGHPVVREHMRQFLGDRGVDAAVANVNNAGNQVVDFAIPGFPPFHVCASKVLNETSGELDFILPDDVLLVTTPPGVPVDGEEIATTHTFRRRGASSVGFETREFRVEGRGNGGTMVVANMADIAVVTGNNCGGLIASAHQ
jgi:hypothetical protein